MKVYMMINKRTHDISLRENQSGFTLFELMLSVALFGMIMMGIFQVMNDSMEKELARNTSKYMENIAEAVEGTLKSDLNTFTAIYNHLAANPLCAGGDPICTQEYTVANFANGFNVPISGIPILPSSRLGNNVRAVNPLHSDITIVMAIADDPNNANDIAAINVLVAATEPAPIQKVLRAASQAGPNGGVFDDMYPDFNAATGSGSVAIGDALPNIIESAYGAWNIDIMDFRGTAWFNAVVATPPTPDVGTYLVHRSYVNFQDTSGDYLYRVQQINPELHVMLSNLNLGGNNIIGADNINVQDEMTVANQIIVEGDARLMNNLDVEGSLYVDGPLVMNDVTFDHEDPALRVSITGADFIDSGGNPNANRFTTLGDVTITTLSMNNGGELSADRAILRNVVAQDIDATNPTLSVNALGNVTAGSVNATEFFADNAASNIVIDEQLNATQLNFNGRDLTINGNAGFLQMDTNANVTVDGNFNVPVFSGNNVRIDGSLADPAGSGRFGRCSDGCGE
jgi:prepilin-type N-terminal cleavage/methylation domain-containing protein